MRLQQLILRCYAEQIGDQWQAFCLDLNLAVQGDTREEVKAKLDAMMLEYLSDALTGEDREYADQLIPRRAPLGIWVRYYWAWVRVHAWKLRDGFCTAYKRPMQLTPQLQS